MPIAAIFFKQNLNHYRCLINIEKSFAFKSQFQPQLDPSII